MFDHNETAPLANVIDFLAGAQGDSVRSAWEARFPNVSLNLTVDLSKYHDGRIDRAYYEGTHVADIAVIQTLQDFPRWKAENRLSYYKPNNFDDLLANEKDLDGAYLPIQISTMPRPPHKVCQADSHSPQTHSVPFSMTIPSSPPPLFLAPSPPSPPLNGRAD